MGFFYTNELKIHIAEFFVYFKNDGLFCMIKPPFEIGLDQYGPIANSLL